MKLSKTMRTDSGHWLRRSANGWEFLSEGVGYEADAWYPAADVLGPFSGSGVDTLLDELADGQERQEQLAVALKGLQKVIGMLMPGVSKIPIQDYQLLNEAPIAAAQALAAYEKAITAPRTRGGN
ncbi:hypothetical protein [Pseudomonas aeruginosa]|uniref:hypothetical protein n=1 Tax=Pseudomonas aeruginosa TaxID=287 RepID=UPI00292BCCA5|nr:hypothetical protein [Pseudomonas aeruginosa]HBO8691534.1 hypothetical protein [Pseudomonas aeruginosa]HCE6201545.1 hypothetical protein [Pseudomonas aeruginosa]HCG0275711.1 hypothetical protein [Pseudomonas aeruginosa]HCG0296165.1 hypothetical protein [Pseudomonas aeruginosa]